MRATWIVALAFSLSLPFSLVAEEKQNVKRSPLEDLVLLLANAKDEATSHPMWEPYIFDNFLTWNNRIMEDLGEGPIQIKTVRAENEFDIIELKSSTIRIRQAKTLFLLSLPFDDPLDQTQLAATISGLLTKYTITEWNASDVGLIRNENGMWIIPSSNIFQQYNKSFLAIVSNGQIHIAFPKRTRIHPPQDIVFTFGENRGWFDTEPSSGCRRSKESELMKQLFPIKEDSPPPSETP